MEEAWGFGWRDGVMELVDADAAKGE